jgi:hypothetical protein
MAAPSDLCNTKQFYANICFHYFYLTLLHRYFINLNEKTTTWEDPRTKYKHVYGPSIPMQV